MGSGTDRGYMSHEERGNFTEDLVSAALHVHYYKDCPYDEIDVYRVLEMFDVSDPCLQHAIKKLLVAGGRGHKDIHTDIQNTIDTLERWKQMRKEEE